MVHECWADDLIDLMFESVVPMELARRVLEGLLEAGKVQVRDPQGQIPTDAKPALQDAYDRALVRVFRSDKADMEGEGDWEWTWIGLPTGFVVYDVVDYFNEIIDASLALPCLTDLLKVRQTQYRFVRPHNVRRAFPQAHGSQAQDMRPDFVVLPLKRLRVLNPTTPEGRVKYRADKPYSNFSMIRLSGECETRSYDPDAKKVHKYMRGARQSQPWQYYATAMTVTEESIGFMRGDGSGVEKAPLVLKHGVSSLEFVRLLLSIALADEETFGKSRHFELSEEHQMLPVKLPRSPWDIPVYITESICSETTVSHHSSCSPEGDLQHDEGPGGCDHPPHQNPESGGPATQLTSGSPASQSALKRKRADDDPDTAEPPSKKTDLEESMYQVQAPTRAFGYNCKGLLFNNACIGGRGTVVLVIEEPSDAAPKLRALKMAWQDVPNKRRRDRTLKLLLDNQPHENVLRPTKLPIDEDNTLRTIRCYTQEMIKHRTTKEGVVHRVLEVHITDLGRPVEFFWSIQDFVMGLRGALLGHEYLVSIGILHRDVSPNNVLLGLSPLGPRGYIMDFDMAVAYHPPPEDAPDSKKSVWSLLFADERRKRRSAERIGTTPFMSMGVLGGRDHTHYDDIESFFYVLLLFFVTYIRPLSESDLLAAHNRHYTRTGIARPGPHAILWPTQFDSWNTDGSIAGKLSFFMPERNAFRPLTDFLIRAWKDRRIVLDIVNLLLSCSELFQKREDCHVSHQEFVGVLDKWLEEHPVPVEGYNSCPFRDSEQKQYV